jgi:hypothetical protein
MTVRFDDIVSEQVPAADTTIYTAPANCQSVQITYAAVCCEDATGDSISVNLVQSGATAAVTNLYVKAKAVTAGATVHLTEIIGATLRAGDFISVIAANAARLNLKISVKEIY